MAVTSKLVLTHVNGNDNVVLLGDGAKFVLVIGDKHTKPFSEADSAALVKELTGIKVAIKKAKLSVGRNIPPADKVVIVVGEDVTIDTEVSYQILETVISTKVQDTWPLKVVTENDVIAFPAGVVDDVVKYLLAQDVAKAPTAGMYDKIVFVNALPEENIEETTAYVLDKAQDDKAAGSAWLNVDGEWMELTDDEEEEGSNAAPAEQTTDNTSTVDPKPTVVPETQTEP